MTDIIEKKTIENAADMVAAQLHEYQKEINEACLACDDALTVSLPIKFKPENSTTRIETSIKFYTGQIKDSASGTSTKSSRTFSTKRMKPGNAIGKSFSGILTTSAELLRRWDRFSFTGGRMKSATGHLPYHSQPSNHRKSHPPERWWR